MTRKHENLMNMRVPCSLWWKLINLSLVNESTDHRQLHSGPLTTAQLRHKCKKNCCTEAGHWHTAKIGIVYSLALDKKGLAERGLHALSREARFERAALPLSGNATTPLRESVGFPAPSLRTWQ